MNRKLPIILITGLMGIAIHAPCFAGPPANVVIQGPAFIKEPKLIFLQAYNVYLAEDHPADVFKFKNNWYWRDGQKWHVANRHNGPWLIMKTPPPFIAPSAEITQRYKKVPIKK